MKSTGTRLLLGLGLVGLPLAGAAAYAISVQPMSYDLTPSGAGASRDLNVKNPGNRPLPVELRVSRRYILSDGSERRESAEDDFLIFPPQAIVPANDYQTFRVKYVGDPSVDRTRLYLVTVAQLPVQSREQGNAGVQFLFNFGTLAAVSPTGSKPQLVVSNVKPASEPNALQVTVRNDGNRYARLVTGAWRLRAGDGRVVTLEGQRLLAALKQPLIEANSVRVINLPVPHGFQRTGASATFVLSRAP